MSFNRLVTVFVVFMNGTSLIRVSGLSGQGQILQHFKGCKL